MKKSLSELSALLSQINDMVHNVWNKYDDYEKKLQTFTAFYNALCEKKEALNELLNSLADAIMGKQKELEHIDYE